MTELPNKVREALKNVPPFKKVVVGLSGGMDSVVMTHLLKRLGYDLVAAHLNHGLRGQASDDDAEFVKELATAWNIPFFVNKAVIPRRGNTENNARKIRYAYLEAVRQSYGADFIAVGHHFDDQIETILMHDQRGAGLRGLRGMNLVKEKIIRPLLDIPRKDIEQYAKENLLDYVTDETNFDLSLERNRLRHEVIPQLKENPEFEENIRKMSKEADEQIKTLSARASEWMQDHFKTDHFDRHAFNQLEKELKMEITLILLGHEDVYRPTLERFLHFAQEAKSGKELVAKGKVFVIEYEKIRCFSEKSADLVETEFKDEIQWGDYHIKISINQPLKVRPWKKGDRFHPSGMQGSKKLQDFFVDLKVPRHQRRRIPILIDQNNEIICVGNLRFSEPHKSLKDSILIQKIQPSLAKETGIK